MSITRCKSCLIPTTRPDTAFVDGECTACVNFRNRPAIDWEQRERELVRILETAPKNDSGYDCIVPSSGGKDSTAQVIDLLTLGARPLVVTATTCYLTPIGRRNIDNLARFATTVEITPNREVRKRLNRLGLELVGDISHPEHMAIFSTPFRAARDFGIPLIFYGENPQREYGSPLGAEEARTMTRRWVAEFGGFLGLRPVDFVGMDGLTAIDMADYMLPHDDDMAKIDSYFLGQFIPWDSHANARAAVAMGMDSGLPSDANAWPAENLDNAMTGIHDHAMYRKYGYGRMCAQLSVDIRRGRITRSEAMKRVAQFDGAFPYTYAGVSVDDVLDWLERDRAWLIDCLDSHTSWDLFSHVEGNRPILKEFAAEAAE